jgi:hypothetical protein
MKVRVTSVEKKTYWYADKIGEEFNVVKDHWFAERGYRVNNCDGKGNDGWISVIDCVKVTDKSPQSTDDIIANLVRRVAELERGYSELYTESSRKSGDLAKIHGELGGLQNEVKAFREGKAWTHTNPVHVINDMRTIHSVKLTRDEVVAKAKADVEGLKDEGELYGERWEYRQYRNQTTGIGSGKGDAYCAKFIVNREKRTVVCLLRGYNSGKVLKKDIAKCAPNDVFNAHIGKAITLRRALGLEVPTEYTNAPHPTEARVGDVIQGGEVDGFYRKERIFILTSARTDDSFHYAESSEYTTDGYPNDFIFRHQIGKIIDDTVSTGGEA